MRTLVVEHLSLDGVFQAPARADEDPRGGFALGGWAADGGTDPALGEAMSARMGTGFSWLFGRVSYEGMLGHWNRVGGPMADGLNAATTYVASRVADVPLPWPHSRALTGDVPAEVARLRARDGGALVVMGSGTLVRSLLDHDLVDELLLFVHPVALGSGQRLFGDAVEPRRFGLASCSATTAGVVVASYVRSGREVREARERRPG